MCLKDFQGGGRKLACPSPSPHGLIYTEEFCYMYCMSGNKTQLRSRLLHWSRFCYHCRKRETTEKTLPQRHRCKALQNARASRPLTLHKISHKQPKNSEAFGALKMSKATTNPMSLSFRGLTQCWASPTNGNKEQMCLFLDVNMIYLSSTVLLLTMSSITSKIRRHSQKLSTGV